MNVYRLIVTASGEVWIRVYPSIEKRNRDRVDDPTWTIRDYDSEGAINQVLPSDRSKRHAWRWQGNRVIADPAVPDPPKRRQALIDEVNAATTIAALRAAILKLL